MSPHIFSHLLGATLPEGEITCFPDYDVALCNKPKAEYASDNTFDLSIGHNGIRMVPTHEHKRKESFMSG